MPLSKRFTLTQYLIEERRRFPSASGDFNSLILDVALACKGIAKAVAFGEALRPDFKDYSRAVIANAQILAATLKARGCEVVAGGTDTHLALIDLSPKGITGKDADEALERAGITCNKNGVPFDPLPPTKTSGIRVGTPAMTTRGFKDEEARITANLIADVLDNPHDEANIAAVRAKVHALTSKFPVYK